MRRSPGCRLCRARRRAGRAARLRAARHLANARRERHHGDVGAVGRRRRAARRRRHDEVRGALGRARRRSRASRSSRPGVLRLGGVMDLVSKPVMTGFLFGLGLTVTVGQLPELLGVPAGSGNFFPRVGDLVRDLDDVNRWTLAVGLACVVALVVLRRLAPQVPAIARRARRLDRRLGAARPRRRTASTWSGELPDGATRAGLPDAGWRDLVDLLPAALGVLIVSAEAVGVARTIAAPHGLPGGREPRPRRRSAARTCWPASRAASCSRAARARRWRPSSAGGKSQLAALVAAGLVLVTGAVPHGAVPRPAAGDAGGDRRSSRSRASSASTSCGASRASGGARSCWRWSRSSACCCSACCRACWWRSGCRSCW